MDNITDCYGNEITIQEPVNGSDRIFTRLFDGMKIGRNEHEDLDTAIKMAISTFDASCPDVDMLPTDNG